MAQTAVSCDRSCMSEPTTVMRKLFIAQQISRVWEFNEKTRVCSVVVSFLHADVNTISAYHYYFAIFDTSRVIFIVFLLWYAKISSACRIWSIFTEFWLLEVNLTLILKRNTYANMSFLELKQYGMLKNWLKDFS